MLQEQRWLTIGQAASHISMSVGFLRNRVRLRTISFTRIGSKTLRFDRNALDIWMAEGSCQANYDREHCPTLQSGDFSPDASRRTGRRADMR